MRAHVYSDGFNFYHTARDRPVPPRARVDTAVRGLSVCGARGRLTCVKTDALTGRSRESHHAFVIDDIRHTSYYTNQREILLLEP